MNNKSVASAALAILIAWTNPASAAPPTVEMTSMSIANGRAPLHRGFEAVSAYADPCGNGLPVAQLLGHDDLRSGDDRSEGGSMV